MPGFRFTRPFGTPTLLVLATLNAMTPLRAQVPAPHALGAVATTSPVTFHTFTQMARLSDGRVFVNEPGPHQLLLLDADLGSPIVVLDSAPGKENTYPTGGQLTLFRGDSVLVYDSGARSFLVIGPTGHIGRIMAAPTITTQTLVGYSSTYGLVYYTHATTAAQYPLGSRVSPGDPDRAFSYEDSLLVVVVDINTRKADTIAKLSSGQVTKGTIIGGRGFGMVNTATAMFPFRDELSVMPDGALAILRSRDYRVEWLNADRTRTVAPRIPYPWRHIAEDERARMLDSINTEWRAHVDSAVARWISDSASGKPRMATIGSMSPDGAMLTRQIPVPRPGPPPVAEPSEIPDYFPPTACVATASCPSTGAALRSGADGQVWIRETIGPVSQTDETIYDVVDRTGALVDRVLVPPGHHLFGFAPGGFAFLVWSDPGRGLSLKKVSFR